MCYTTGISMTFTNWFIHATIITIADITICLLLSWQALLMACYKDQLENIILIQNTVQIAATVWKIIVKW